MARRPLTAFLVVVLGLSWLLFSIPVLAFRGVIPGANLPVEVFALASTLLILLPTALWVTSITDGRAGVGALFARVFRWRFGVGWWLVVLFGLPVIALVLTGAATAAYTVWDAHAVRNWHLSPVAFMVGCTLVEIPLFSLALRRRGRELLPALRAHWPRLFAFGVLSPLAYILVLVAITLAPVALVAPMREVSVVLVSIYGALVLHERRARWRIAASVLVAAGIVLIAA